MEQLKKQETSLGNECMFVENLQQTYDHLCFTHYVTNVNNFMLRKTIIGV